MPPEWDGILATKITDAELDAAATDLRGTLEVMLTHLDDQQAEQFGVKRSAAVWRPKRAPVASCWICRKAIPDVYAAGRVAHTKCVEYEAAKR